MWELRNKGGKHGGGEGERKENKNETLWDHITISTQLENRDSTFVMK